MKQAPSVVQIDEHNLDKECINLPSQYLQYAHLAAEAKRDVGELKAELDVVEADLSKSVRADPAKYGIEKLTEAGLKEVVRTRKAYRETQDRLQEAQYHAELAQAVVWALEHKKRSLTLLVDLHGMGYFSSPKVSKAGREAVDDMTKNRVRRRHQDE
jgi:chorismate mutase